MDYIIEKKGLSGYSLWYRTNFELWDEVAKEKTLESAKQKATNLLNEKKGSYRVRSSWTKDVLFSIAR